MLSEHLAHYFFRRLGEQAEDHVLSDLLSRIADDEVRHAQSASDLIAKRIAANRRSSHECSTRPRISANSAKRLSALFPSHSREIQSRSRHSQSRIERLCGIRLVDHIKSGL